MEQHSTGGLYLNFPGLGEEKEALVRVGYGVNYDRLVELKTKYDPTNLFPDEPEHPTRKLTPPPIDWRNGPLIAFVEERRP
jgi:Berberine and berberine like